MLVVNNSNNTEKWSFLFTSLFLLCPFSVYFSLVTAVATLCILKFPLHLQKYISISCVLYRWYHAFCVAAWLFHETFSVSPSLFLTSHWPLFSKALYNLFGRPVLPAALQSLKPFHGASFSDLSIHLLALKHSYVFWTD